MSQRRRRWLLAAGLLFSGAALYLSWQFGLFARPHEAAPLVVPEEAPAAQRGGTTGPGSDQGKGNSPDGGRQNILLLGVDSRGPGEQARSDVILLLSVDLIEGKAAVLSIPRDTRVEIPGRGQDKINHAHAYGGVDLALRTVANAFQVPIHHWVRIDMAGMVPLIDKLGPITVEVHRPLTLRDGSRLEPGPVPMDGELALLYLRERYSDPQGDIGRSERARDFLIDLARQLAKGIEPADLPRFYAILREHADTDIRLQDGLWQRALRIDLDAVQQGRVVGRDRMIDGVYYYEVDWAETERVLKSLGIRQP